MRKVGARRIALPHCKHLRGKSNVSAAASLHWWREPSRAWFTREREERVCNRFACTTSSSFSFSFSFTWQIAGSWTGWFKALCAFIVAHDRQPFREIGCAFMLLIFRLVSFWYG